ncbi:sensor histidine kinase [Micromonospora sp. 067-2]|uniref:sensor histidine kinase n=1 Tax=Micromonospora sp. 067-2 TaxID=2789270 RepID=UPI00397E60C6
MTWAQLAVAVLAVLGMAQVVTEASRSGPTSAQALILTLVGTVPLAMLARQPLAALVTILVAYLFSFDADGHPTAAVMIAAVVAAWLAGRRCRPLQAAVAATPALAAPLLAVTQQQQLATIGSAVILGAATVGGIRRTRRASVQHQVTVRAMQGALLEHVARGERARIARELHDVVAHHVSLIAVRAEAAQFVADRPAPANAAEFATIAGDARTALAEMRRLLGVLRADADAEPDERAPQPDLDQLAGLVAGARMTQGAAIRLTLRGPVRPLDSGIELIAYRIVQEALTNARRHAPGAAVDVDLSYSADTLEVWVLDTGPGPRDAGSGGHGLTGMRERTATLGGQLWAGCAPSGGYLIRARLPI